MANGNNQRTISDEIITSKIYLGSEPTDYNKYRYPDYGNCKLRKSESEIKDVEVFEYTKKPTHFILGFINVNYFNKLIKGNYPLCS